MKLHSLTLALLACVATASAYLSEGWKPGQPVTQEAPQPLSTPGAQPQAGGPPPAQAKKNSGSLLDVTRLLEVKPLAGLFGKLGVNISQQLEAARASANPELWDPRVPLITDDNYDELIVREQTTLEEEEKRVWFIVISAQGSQRGAISKSVDETFDSAYNISMIKGDLPFVRWGRIDYLNVTYLTTKWNVWQAPYIVIIRDHGQTLYFYQANHIRLDVDLLREFLLNEAWRQTHPWQSPFSPGGSLEPAMHYFGVALRKIYSVMVVIPGWLLMIISGALASLLMKVIHRNPPAVNSAKKESGQPAAAASAETPSASTTATPTSTPSKSKGGAKSRKTGKK